jgi:hypothetical protein
MNTSDLCFRRVVTIGEGVIVGESFSRLSVLSHVLYLSISNMLLVTMGGLGT